MFLFSKSMMVHGEAFADDPDHQADLTDFWCVQTATSLGPDADEVNVEMCSNRERSCWCEY
jgi:hypothetical protein